MSALASPGAELSQSGGMPRAVRALAAELLRRAAELGRSMIDHPVLAFLAAGGSATRVAKELYIHQNTVAYRVKRAEKLLGRRVTESPIELTCALTLAAALGSAVLSG
jgi:DNA-binding PucR family transcriptional regulator